MASGYPPSPCYECLLLEFFASAPLNRAVEKFRIIGEGEDFRGKTLAEISEVADGRETVWRPIRDRFR